MTPTSPFRGHKIAFSAAHMVQKERQFLVTQSPGNANSSFFFSAAPLAIFNPPEVLVGRKDAVLFRLGLEGTLTAAVVSQRTGVMQMEKSCEMKTRRSFHNTEMAIAKFESEALLDKAVR